MTLSRRFPRRYEHAAPEVEIAAVPALAFPKVKYIPRREASHGLALPKDAPDRDRPYLDYVRGELCAAWPEDSTHCAGVTEAAHLEVAGKGIKASDYLAVPLCTFHHALQHQIGLAQFQITIGVNLWECATRLLVGWIRIARRGKP
jgi:hypothetical protein